MASKQEYLNMMKRMEQGMEQGMGEERIPAPMNMGLDSMMNKPSGSVSDKEMVPFMTDPNLKRLNVPKMTPNDLMEILGKTTGQPSDFTMKELEALKGSLSDREMDILEGQRKQATDMNALRNAMGAGMTGNILEEMKKLDPNSAVRDDEMMKMLGDLTMSDREAIEGLTSMGVTLEDALQAILGVNEADTMPEGALGSLPTRTGRRTGGAVSDKDFDPMIGDKTQSLDMQDTATGT